MEVWSINRPALLLRADNRVPARIAKAISNRVEQRFWRQDLFPRGHDGPEHEDGYEAEPITARLRRFNRRADITLPALLYREGPRSRGGFLATSGYLLSVKRWLFTGLPSNPVEQKRSTLGLTPFRRGLFGGGPCLFIRPGESVQGLSPTTMGLLLATDGFYP